MAEGCTHYQNRCEIFAPCCKTYFRCFRCHNEQNKDETPGCETTLDRSRITTIRCTGCGLEQEPVKSCVGCQISFAEYVCLECSLYRHNDPVGIFHCPDCGICRVGEGIGTSHWHCHSCCLCLSIEVVDPEQHRKICTMDTTNADCSICFEPLHDSQENLVVGYYCAHCLHQSCCEAYFQTSRKIACPICQKPIVHMEAKKFLQRIVTTKVLTAVVGPTAMAIIVATRYSTPFGSYGSIVQAIVVAIAAICILENLNVALVMPRRRCFVWSSALLLVSLYVWSDAMLQQSLKISEHSHGT